MQMIIMKTILGITTIALILSITYLVGRVMMPLIDPDTRREPTSWELYMLAGFLGYIAICVIGMIGVAAYMVGEVITSYMQ